MHTTNNQYDAFDTWGVYSTVKWHEYGENATPVRREGWEKEQKQEGDGMVNHDTALSIKWKTRGMMQAWVAQKTHKHNILWVIFDVWFDKYLRRLLVKTGDSKRAFKEYHAN
jgi:hypothetical protein